jgi:hypothetical protein
VVLIPSNLARQAGEAQELSRSEPYETQPTWQRSAVDRSLPPARRSRPNPNQEPQANRLGQRPVFGYVRSERPASGAAERRRRGTRKDSRALTCFWQAVVGLRWFRENADPSALARDHGISRATAYRYLDEVIEVLADQAPDVHEAIQQAHEEDLPYLILDGKLFGSDRYGEKTTSVKGEAIDLWYSGKAGEHGGNIQALSGPNGFPLWVSDVEPGSVHDLTAAREHVLPVLYAGAARGLRCLGERGFAVLTGRWRTLQHITASPRKIGDIVQAALVLTHFEHTAAT